jgi:outer membrane biogenesis lipoprotein LolB
MGISANAKRLGWLVLLGCLLAGCKAISAADSVDDTKQWQGTWKLVAYTYDGETQTADMAWIVDGDHYNIRMNGHLNEDPHMVRARHEPKANRRLSS